MARDEEVRKSALTWINELIASDEAEDWETADEFVAVTTNEETKSLHLTGGFTNPVAALAWAAQHEIDLNKGAAPDEIPFVVRVYPMRQPS